MFPEKRVLSGAMHYFRVPREYWPDRLHKLRLLGLNTVETYVCWNLHEPRPGQFDFTGNLDLVAYGEAIAAEGLDMIVRAGPYICSEWDGGGLPWWLLKDPGMRVRCCYGPYLEAVDRFFDALLPPLVPLLASHGGPIVAMQVENEYGSFGNDTAYLRHLADGMRARGIDVPFFTSDGPTDQMFQGGTLDDALITANFGTRTAEAFAKLREYRPDGPLMCMEFWNGWFDHWGEEHHYRDPAEAAQVLDEILAAGASVNFYMAHGGTNFGLMAGANHRGVYQPDVTSYDYGAPLDEPGDITPKYRALREVFARYTDVPDEPLPPPSPKRAYGDVPLTESVGLGAALEALGRPVEAAYPMPMEELDQGFGLVVYRTHISGPRPEGPLEIVDLHDRAQVFLNGHRVGILDRRLPDRKLSLTIPPGGATLELVVSALGRVNFGPVLFDRKGITRGVMLNSQYLFGWTMVPVPLADLAGLAWAPGPQPEAPAFYRGTFTVDACTDTFLAVPGGTHGIVWVNGRCLGRYWDIGPQRTLYLPAPWLTVGANEVVILELDAAIAAPRVELRDTSDLGALPAAQRQ